MARPKIPCKKVKISLTIDQISLEFLKASTDNISNYIDNLIKQKIKFKKIKSPN